MGRTLPSNTEIRPDPSRILALAAAIAIHALAFLLLLVPMAAPQLAVVANPDRPKVRLIEAEKEKVIEEVTIVEKFEPVPPEPIVTRITQAVTPKADPPVIIEGGSEPVSVSTAFDAEPALDLGPTFSGPVSVSSLSYVKAPAPIYPREAARAGIEGTVLLKVLVDIDGSPLEVIVQKSSGSRLLDGKAREQVLKNWRFQPAIRDGQAVQAYGLVPIDFTMQ